jgi:hypothetical protein
MAPRFLTILTGRNLPKIRQSSEPGPSIINERTIGGDFAFLRLPDGGPDGPQADEGEQGPARPERTSLIDGAGANLPRPPRMARLPHADLDLRSLSQHE